MSTITLTIPDPIKDRVINALCSTYGYEDEIPKLDSKGNPEVDGQGNEVKIPNPVTKPQFAKTQLLHFLKEVTKGYEARNAGDSARDAALEKAESEINLE